MSTGNIPLNPAIPNELITSALWNAEFGNIQTLTAPEGIEGYEDTDPETQIQTAPFPGSVLNKATSLAGEIERIRYQLAQILGTDFWYKPAALDVTSASKVVVPVGGIIDYPESSVPNSSWHLADGTALSRAGFPTLFALIGTDFGVGDGVTTFNLPDYRDRMSIGAGLTYPRASTGGEATHTLTVPEIPAGLTVTDPTHTHTAVDTGHTHTVPGHDNDGSGDKRYASGLSFAAASGVQETTLSGNGNIVVSAHSTGISVGGGGTAHNNLPPYLGMYKMIRVL